MQIRAIIDSKIRLELESLHHGIYGDICQALTIPNTAREAAEKNGVYGWQKMPEYIELWKEDEFSLIIPRGFAHNLADGVEGYGFQSIEWHDDRADTQGVEALAPLLPPRDHQTPAIAAIIDNEQGIYKAPAGSGKTATVLMAIGQLGVKSLIIVNTKDVMWQWQKRIETFLGKDYPWGQIGDGKMEISEGITIATAQTLHSRYDELLAEGFFDLFGFVCLDECHHATADTYNRVVDSFTARWRIGVSATPDKTGDFELATAVLGPIFFTTTPKELQGQGILIQPIIYRVNTGFTFAFRGAGGRGQRSNYGKLLERLIADPERNEIIVKAIMKEEGTHGLLITKRIEHIEILMSMVEDAGYEYPMVTLTGQDKNSHREYVVELLAKEPGLIFSTLADEALDIPRLDRGFLPFPQKNTGLITQQVGRFERFHSDKKDAKIYDFVDGKVGPLDSQWKGRRFEVYEPRGYTIERIKGEDL